MNIIDGKSATNFGTGCIATNTCNSFDGDCRHADRLRTYICCMINNNDMSKPNMAGGEFSSALCDIKQVDEKQLFHCECSTPLQDPKVSINCQTSIQNDSHHFLADATKDDKELLSTSLGEELLRLKAQLRSKEEQCEKMTKLHDQTGLELQDLTASLFEEANNMVQEANIKRMATEKKLNEANAKIEILQAEVTALKTLVITSTPSSPNPHLNPQINRTKTSEFAKGHRRSTSHHNFVKDAPCTGNSETIAVAEPPFTSKDTQVEPLYMELFLQWKLKPCLNPDTPFMSCITREDILPCLCFANESLSKSILDGVFQNTLTVEPLLNCSASGSHKCSLTDLVRPCHYSIKLDGSQTPFAICQPARNRIIAVCDLLTYLRYIAQGLVKCDEIGMYLEVARLRKKMCMARLGLNG